MGRSEAERYRQPGRHEARAQDEDASGNTQCHTCRTLLLGSQLASNARSLRPLALHLPSRPLARLQQPLTPLFSSSQPSPYSSFNPFGSKSSEVKEAAEPKAPQVADKAQEVKDKAKEVKDTVVEKAKEVEAKVEAKVESGKKWV